MTMKFKVIGAPHTERGKQIGTDANGSPVYAEVVYNRGEIVETDIDLAKRFNPKGSPSMAKFVRLADTARATFKEFSRFSKEGDSASVAVMEESEVDEEEGEYVPEQEEPEETGMEGAITLGEDTLSSMTVAELRLHAGAEGIDLSGATTKAEILKRIRKAY